MKNNGLHGDSGIPEELERILNGEVALDTERTTDQRIIDWNRERNGLAFNSDLEIKMLQEECNEFFQAETMVERLQEFSDFLFVYTGTVAKYSAVTLNNVASFQNLFQQMAEIQTWAEERMSMMSRMVVKEIQFLTNHEEDIEQILQGALDAVISANEAKGTEKDENGKVVKGPDYVSPVTAIQTLIRDVTGRFVQ